MTVSLVGNNIEKGWGIKYGMEMVPLLFLLFGADIFILLMFAAAVCRLSYLIQGLVKIFSKVTAYSGENKIKNKWGIKYDT